MSKFYGVAVGPVWQTWVRSTEAEGTGMKVIGILFGTENSFPGALVERINGRNLEGICAEFVQTGAVGLNQAQRYAVIIDRISHQVPFYRAFLKCAALQGTAVINDPFWWSADDKFFNYALAARLGVAVPPTVILPHKHLPAGTSDKTMRNLEYPLNWDAVFAYAGEDGYLKPIDGGGWRNVHRVHSRQEFFAAYDQSRDLCMMYQKAVHYSAYFRCFVVGRKNVRTVPYDPRRPHSERYLSEEQTTAEHRDRKLIRRLERDALSLCRALGYDINSVEFAVQDGVPYAIDFLNPVPEAELNSIGEASFDWLVEQIADLAIAKARRAPQPPEVHWPAALAAAEPPKKRPSSKPKPKQKKTAPPAESLAER
jgi:glutathione synthase/RimK-type ligase-like ATP-grasp enzyme